MQDAVPENKREKWRQWAQNEFGENEQAVQVATETVLNALLTGCSINEAMNIARTAAAGPSPNLRATASATEIDSRTEAQQPPVSDSEHLRGCVSSFRQRNELMGQQFGTVWNFRVDSWDWEGRAQPAVGVEMRGFRFTGSVADGDWVEIKGHWKAGDVMPISSLRNISLNSIVAVDVKSIVAVDGGGSPGHLNRFAFKLGRWLTASSSPSRLKSFPRFAAFVLVISALSAIFLLSGIARQFTIVHVLVLAVLSVLIGSAMGIRLAISVITTVLVFLAAAFAGAGARLI